ncbi:hypothetical protein OSB04_013812 [Centaurea solstitialis]|uniref:Dirigent protein n=1 Tax=Centaurea solstitialis TaxID=347529 RepID=A0AA38TDY7_9ASTR|nr:hypothetical protein OSB04_013812 [Centaurea solstitialis]
MKHQVKKIKVKYKGPFTWSNKVSTGPGSPGFTRLHQLCSFELEPEPTTSNLKKPIKKTGQENDIVIGFGWTDSRKEKVDEMGREEGSRRDKEEEGGWLEGDRSVGCGCYVVNGRRWSKKRKAITQFFPYLTITMAQTPLKQNLIILIVLLFSLLFQGESHKFSRNLPSKSFPFKKEKITHIHFYFHDITSGNHPTAFKVAEATVTNTSNSLFGIVVMIDDPLTMGPERTSKIVGRAQGLYASADIDEFGLLMVLNYVFVEGKYNGSTLSILGRNLVMSTTREMPIVGGTGLFRFARGYALAKTHFFNISNGDAIVEYNFTLAYKRKTITQFSPHLTTTMAQTLLKQDHIILTILIFSLLMQGESHKFSRNMSSKSFPFKKEKISHLHFYFHNIASGDHPTAVEVVKAPATNTSDSFFGFVVMIDDPLTVGPERTSKIVGRAQGLYASADLDELGFLMVLNYVFVEGKYNGSTLSILGRNQIISTMREMPIVGGTGIFRFARGYALAKTHFVNMSNRDAIVEYNMFQHIANGDIRAWNQTDMPTKTLGSQGVDCKITHCSGREANVFFKRLETSSTRRLLNCESKYVDKAISDLISLGSDKLSNDLPPSPATSGDLRLLPPATSDDLRRPATATSGNVRRPLPPSTATSDDLRLLPPATYASLSGDVRRPAAATSGDVRRPATSGSLSGDVRRPAAATSGDVRRPAAAISGDVRRLATFASLSGDLRLLLPATSDIRRQLIDVINKTFLTIILFSLLNQGESHTFARNGSSKSFPFKKEKISHLHFYFHNIVGGDHPTAIRVTEATFTNTFESFFGLVVMIDDPLTVGPERTSKIVGRAQGLYASADLDEFGLLMVLNYVFVEGKYNGITLSILGRNRVMSTVREMPIVGETGLFHFARGYALAKTHFINPSTRDAVVEYNVYNK